jgi:DNA-binding CsgD family transcriptional regulator
MVVTGSTAVEKPVLGRHDEKLAVEELLSSARRGRSGVLVIEGEAGMGKSTLLQYASEQATGFRVVRLSGVESEMELAFSGLHQLCLQLPLDNDRLPEPQLRALKLAFGLAPGVLPDCFLVALALLTLVSNLAQGGPCLLLVDDAQWLDQVTRQVLGFVARRLEVDPVAICFATREPLVDLGGLRAIQLDGLPSEVARQLLNTVLPGPVGPRVRDAILDISNGNPLAILEIPHGLSAVDLAGEVTFGGFSGRLNPVERNFEQRIAKLPTDTRTLLLLAAAEPQGNWAIVSRAADLLGVAPGALDAAELEGLCRVDRRGGIAFHHPLVRSAVYRLSSSAHRQAVHQALATALELDHGRDRRAWHRALASIGPDEEIAAELERSATEATERGGIAAGAALLARSVALTPDTVRRNERTLLAAEAVMHSGNLDEARRFLDTAITAELNGPQLARMLQLEARLNYAVKPGAETIASLVEAAKQLLPHDANLARDTYLEALVAAMQRTSSDGKHGWIEIARSLRALLDRSKPLQAVDLLLDGLTTTVIEGHHAGAPILKRALQAYLRGDVGADEILRWWQLGFYAAAVVWDDVSWTEVMDCTVRVARESGSLLVLASALNYQAIAQLGAGDIDLADGAIQEGEGILASIGQPMALTARPVVEALRGSSHSTTTEDVYGLVADYTSAMMLANGRGDFQAGLDAAHRAMEHKVIGKTMIWQEIIEVATGSGDQELARAALQVVRSQVEACGTDLGLGTLARCEALLSSGQEAEAQYQEAILRLSHSQAKLQNARAHLVYGEWLTREGRESDATHALQVAHELFRHMGAQAFAGRAERALEATGLHVGCASYVSPGQLTPRENQIARLAAQRQTNPEIAAQLFISSTTVDYHLRKVFRKLNVNSRRQLQEVLPHVPH